MLADIWLRRRSLIKVCESSFDLQVIYTHIFHCHLCLDPIKTNSFEGICCKSVCLTCWIACCPCLHCSLHSASINTVSSLRYYTVSCVFLVEQTRCSVIVHRRLQTTTKLEAIGNKKLKWGCTDWCTLRKFLWETLVSLPKVNVPQLRLIIISSSQLTAKYKRSISISMAWYRYNNLNINLTKQTNSFKINIVICGVKKENVWYCKAGQCSHSGNCNIQSLASSTMVMLILICECQHRNQSVRIDSILISWLVEQDVTRWQTNKKLTSLL